MSVIGRIHSIQSLGTLDGPGVRFVIFVQGCNLRCGCCHNPDTWDISGGKEYTARELFERALRYREYFGSDGGVTVSGGEPLLQPDFCRELFELCHGAGINTCLDTSGSIMNDRVKALLALTDRVLLDIKYTTEPLYCEYVGCGMYRALDFLAYLNAKAIPVTLRQVIIPTLNDNEQNILELKRIMNAHPCVDSAELLPFRKLCEIKYDKMGIEFPFSHIPEPSKDAMERLEKLLSGDAQGELS